MPKGLCVTDFLGALDRMIERAEALGRSQVRVNAGELHQACGLVPAGTEGLRRAMPSCCNAMWQRFDPARDSPIVVPSSRKGASLTLSYSLPRK